MKTLLIRIENMLDIPAVLVDALGEFESLRVDRAVWTEFLHSIDVDTYFPYHDRGGEYVPPAIAAEAIVAKACPVEGDIYPRRAVALAQGRGASFTTPGGVVVRVDADGDSAIALRIKFNRDSQYAAFRVIAGLHRRCGHLPAWQDLHASWGEVNAAD